MQRKGNTINRDSQVVNQISVGIDMEAVCGRRPFKTGEQEK